MRDRSAHHLLGPPTPIASFDVRAFARESERKIAASSTTFAHDELPTIKQVAVHDESPPPSTGRFLSIDDGAIVDIERIPTLVIPRIELAWFELGDVAVRLVLRIDGETSVRSILAQGTFTRTEVTAALGELTREGLVQFR